MKKIITLILLCINIFASDTLFVENYTLEEGRYKGHIYTGYINVEGIPHGKGNIQCKENPKKTRYENAEFKNGKIYSGEWHSCRKFKSKFWNTWYEKNYQGEFGDYEDFDKPEVLNQSKIRLTFPDDTDFQKLEGIYRYKQYGRPGKFGYAIAESINGTLIRTSGLISLSCEFVLHEDLKCWEGDITFSYDNGISFKGFLTDRHDLQIEGLLSFSDKTSYEYKGEWNINKIEKLKKRLDIVNKSKPKQNEETKSSIIVEKVKSVKEYNPGVIVEDKKLSKEYKEKELAPINME